jgi:UDP:flavonoid glycosyltransferase YjiC (YdhE family)
MKRVLFATFGSIGDIHPYLALARAVREFGAKPTIATMPMHAARIRAARVRFTPMGPDFSGLEEDELFRRANDARRGTEFVVRELVMPGLRQSYHDLLKASGSADLLVSHPLALAAPLVVEQTGIPWASTVLSPISLGSMKNPPVLARAPWLHRIYRIFPPLSRLILVMLRRGLRKWSEPVRQLRRELGLGLGRGDPLMEGQFSPTLNLAMFSRVLAEAQSDWPPQTVVTGFPFLGTGRAEKTKRLALSAFLDRGDPPIVFTFGSTAVRSARDLFAECVSAARLLGRRALLLVGPDPATVAAWEREPGVLALDYLPHPLAFRNAAVVVHHGGIGTLAEAMRAGHPMLILPFAHDQPDNASRAKRLGIAAVLYRRRWRAKSIARAIDKLLHDPLVGARAAAIGDIVGNESGARSAAEEIMKSPGAPLPTTGSKAAARDL